LESVGPEGYRKLYASLIANGVIPRLVAGQAVNFWATLYRDKEPELANFEPYTSTDLELFDMTIPEHSIENLPDGQIRREDVFSRMTGPDSAMVSYREGEQFRSVSIMTNLLGLERGEIEKRSAKVVMDGLPLFVLDPIALAKGKTANLVHLDQLRGKDLKHLQMSLLCSRAYILEILAKDSPRACLNAIERVIELSDSSNGRKVVQQHRIDWTTCVPWQDLENRKGSEPKVAKFLSLRAPQWRRSLQGGFPGDPGESERPSPERDDHVL